MAVFLEDLIYSSLYALLVGLGSCRVCNASQHDNSIVLMLIV